ncbi:glutathione S-transferase N-terminal domain-containing protein [Shewanella gelidii]|uniref:Glutaredoxin n=1 Tax=Shewanella gelidii TaxID=1642821 RepID=A0A917JTL0_9GAMM|nr:glutathione S-transferase N-terminal domain-containing protein [Shewanella gelidii]MCL1098657.1 glutathione S-transferase N-terminal domain-containing protein [Shewanella gelidii]GGI86273.1 glutaredoxin [Shewanella gelidii]
MFVVRWILGRIILVANFIFTPKKRQRPVSEQNKVDEQTANMALYQYAACPFCVKVRRAMHRQSLNIAIVDAKQATNKEVLEENGGKVQVPCLRIEEQGEVKWMYESKAIIEFLNQKFA